MGIDDEEDAVRIYLRSITKEDGKLIIKWRNAPNVSNHCFTKTVVTEESNRKFLKNILRLESICSL